MARSFRSSQSVEYTESVNQAVEKPEVRSDTKLESKSDAVLQQDTVAVNNAVNSVADDTYDDIDNNSVDSVDDVADTGDFGSKHHSFSVTVVITLAIVILGLGAVLGIWIIGFDKGLYSNTAQNAAILYANAMLSTDDSDLMNCLPPKVRQNGVVAGDNAVSSYRARRDKDGLAIVNIQAGTPTDAMGSIGLINKRITSSYGVDFKIDEALFVPLVLTLSDKNQTNYVELLDVLCIKTGMGWYACPFTVDHTGSTNTVQQAESSEVSADDASASIRESDVAVVEQEASAEDAWHQEKDEPVVITQRMPVQYDWPAINAYRGALNDLKAGQFTLDGEYYGMPAAYRSLTDVISFNENVSNVNPATIQIASGQLYRGISVSYSDPSFSQAPVFASFGHSLPDTKDAIDSFVTTLYIGLPQSDLVEYPQILLPGNIHLGSSYQDVVKVYGNIDKYKLDMTHLEDCFEDEMYVNYLRDDITRWSDDIDLAVYAIELDNNKFNHVYLEFMGSELKAVEWEIFDMNGMTDKSSNHAE